mmetsp:Transcript_15886/g.43528  ORF Transcript_15886/g.43528 Transcript_15886/m.43528 type:complete len:252 (+) Transcript_15886:756-1511(+)
MQKLQRPHRACGVESRVDFGAEQGRVVGIQREKLPAQCRLEQEVQIVFASQGRRQAHDERGVGQLQHRLLVHHEMLGRGLHDVAPRERLQRKRVPSQCGPHQLHGTDSAAPEQANLLELVQTVFHPGRVVLFENAVDNVGADAPNQRLLRHDMHRGLAAHALHDAPRSEARRPGLGWVADEPRGLYAADGARDLSHAEHVHYSRLIALAEETIAPAEGHCLDRICDPLPHAVALTPEGLQFAEELRSHRNL